MASQAFNLTGVGNQDSSTVTLAAGECIRVRFTATVGTPNLYLAVTANAVTQYIPLNSRDTWVYVNGQPGDVIGLRMRGNAPTDNVTGIIETAVQHIVTGNIAAGAAETGNPVAVAGRYDASWTVQAVTGKRMELQTTNLGMAFATLGGLLTVPDQCAAFVYGAPSYGNEAQQVPAALTAQVWDGSAFKAQRGDANGTYVVAKPVTTGGLSQARLVASAGANVKASAGQLYGGTVTNTNAAIRYLHLYNKATAATLGTDTPVATFALPPGASVQITTDGLGAAFATGISWAFTTDDIAIPTTAGATTDLHGTLFYK